MRRQRFLLISTLTLVLSIITVASALALGRGSQTPEDPLARRTLQLADLEGAEAMYRESITTTEGFPGPLSPANLPLRAGGFLAGYRVGAPCTVRLSGGQQGIVYVLNTVYQFQDEAQATAALEQQIEFYEKSDVPEDVRIVPVNYDTSLAFRKGVQGRAYTVQYPSDGVYWKSYYFLGTKGNMLVFLMVDGLPDPATERVFSVLAAKVIQRQDR